MSDIARLQKLISKSKYEDVLFAIDKKDQSSLTDSLLALKIKALIGLKKYGQSHHLLNQKLRDDPSNVIFIELLGLVSRLTENFENSYNEYAKLIELFPDNINFKLEAANAANAIGKYSVSDALMREVILHDPNNPRAYHILAISNLHSGNVKHANEYIDRANNLAPNNPRIMKNLISCKIRCRDHATAQVFSKRLYQLNGDPVAHWNYAFSLYAQGEFEKSLAESKKLLDRYLKNSKLFKEFKVEDSKPSKERLGRTLILFDEACTALKIPYLLLAGTALGFYRDGSFLNNEKDIDVGLPWNTPRAQLLNKLRKYGFESDDDNYDDEKNQWLMSVYNPKLNVGVDLFFMKLDSETDRILIGARGINPLKWSLRKFSKAKKEFLGRVFLVPDPIEQYLEDFYGKDWNTKQHYCVMLRGNALMPGNEFVSLSFGYNRLLSLIKDKDFKKAYAYTEQMLLVCNDTIIRRTQEKLKNIMSETNEQD